jgi:hypothetical protein
LGTTGNINPYTPERPGHVGVADAIRDETMALFAPRLERPFFQSA